MRHRKYFSLLKGTMILIAGSLLAACATNSTSSTSTAMTQKSAVPASACIGNAYLQKYSCSVPRIDQAAKSGDPDAQYALGYMYYYGIGTVRDKQTAEEWIKRAAKQGQPLAKKAEELIAKGSHFHHLHRGSNARGYDTGRRTNMIRHAPTPSVKVMNTTIPSKPLTDVLPNYGKKPSMPTSTHTDTNTDANTNAKPKAVIKSLQKKSDTDNRSNDADAGKVEPITARDPSITAHARAAMTAAEAQMMTVPKQHFTLQLMGGRRLSAIKAFIRNYNLDSKAQYYSAQLNHEKWYMLVYGNYATKDAARMASHQLPAALRRQHPWLKSYRIVHDEIRLRRIVS